MCVFTCIGKSSSLLGVFRQEDSVFVETNAYHRAEETLENYFRVMLSGQPGDGKSAIAKHLIVKKSRQGYRFVLVNGSNDFDSVNFDEKLVLFFDDIFGVTVYDRSRTEDVQRIMWQLDSILMNKYGDVLMIMTSRSHILHDALKVLKNADFVRKVTLDITHGLNEYEKGQILRKHFQFFNLKKEDLDISSFEVFFDQAILLSPNHGFPHCVQMFVQSAALRRTGLDFFRSPIEYLIQILNVMKEAKPMDFAVLAYIALRDGLVNRYADRFPIQDAQRLAFIRKMIGYDVGIDLSEIVSYKSKELDLFLSDNDTYKIFRHPSIQDAVTFMMGEEFTLDIIEICSFSFISGRIRTDQYKCENNEKIITIERQHFPKLCQRFAEEIKQGNIRDVCFHQAMTDPVFVNVFCKTSTVSKSFEKAGGQAEVHLLSYVQFDSIHKFFGSLIYWSSVANNVCLLQNLLQMDGLYELLKGEKTWEQHQLRESFIFTCLHGTNIALARQIGSLIEDKHSKGTTVFSQDILNTLKEPLYSHIFSEASLKLSPLQAAVLSIGPNSLGIVEYLLPFQHQFDILKSTLTIALKLNRQDIVGVFTSKTNVDLDERNIRCALRNGTFTLVQNIDSKILTTAIKSLKTDDLKHMFSHIDNPACFEIFKFVEPNEMKWIFQKALPYAKTIEVASALTQYLTATDVSEVSLDIFQNVSDDSVLEFLISAGADVNSVDSEGHCALFLVNNNDILTTLLENGASVNVREKVFGRNPLMHHGVNGTLSCSVFDTFIKHGVSVNDTCHKGQNLLLQFLSSWNVRKHKEVRKDELQLLEKIIQEMKDFHACDQDGNNMLHICMLANVPVSVFGVVLKQRCDLNAKNQASYSPIHLAISYAYTKSKKKQWKPVMVEHLQYLLCAGAEVNVQDKDGDTVLHLLMSSFVDRLNYYDERLTSYEKLNEESKFELLNSAIDLLLSYNIDVNIRNKKKCTAFNLLSKTRSRRSLQVVEKFLVHKAEFGMSEFLTFLCISSKQENSPYSWHVMQVLSKFVSLRWKDLFANSQCARCGEFSGFIRIVESIGATDQTVLEALQLIINLESSSRCDVLKMTRSVLSDSLSEGLEIVCSSLVPFSKSLSSNKFVSMLFFGILSHAINFFNYRQRSIIKFRNVSSLIIEDIDILIHMMNLPSKVSENRKLSLLISYVESEMNDETLIKSCLPVLLPANFDVNEEVNGTTLLISALKSPATRQEFLQYLCNKGADVNLCIRGDKNHSPLLTVLINDNKKVRKTLTYDNLYKRFTFVTSDKELCGSTQLQLLLQNGLNLRRAHTIFEYIKLEDCCLKSLKLLISHGLASDEVDEKSQTLLHKLCKRSSPSEIVKKPFNRLDILRLLLSNDCCINAQDKDGNTPAHLLAMRRHQNGLEELISKGADINLKNKKGETCLHLAADNAGSVQCLLQYGSDVNITTNDACTALHAFFDLSSEKSKPLKGLALAIEKRFQDIQGIRSITLLLDSGIDINAQNNQGRTAYHLAAYFFDPKWINEIFRLLVRNGADVTLRDNEGKNAIDYVLCRMRSANPEAVKLMIPALKTVIRDASCTTVVPNIVKDMMKTLADCELSELFPMNEG